MKIKYILTFLSFLVFSTLHSQQRIAIEATLNPETKSIVIEEEVVFENTSDTELSEIYFFDWANSFSNKMTPLAKRFAENYDSSFHFEKEENRGHTEISSITTAQGLPFKWERGEEVDILKVTLIETLKPGATVTVKIKFEVTLPDEKFTRYGVTSGGEYKLQYWLISPAVFDGTWQIYSNKNVEDLYMAPTNFEITFKTPSKYTVTSEMDLVDTSISNNIKTTVIRGENRIHADIYLQQLADFETIETDKVAIVTNLRDEKISDPIRAILIDRIVHFLDDKLGEYPLKTLLSTEEEYRKNPVYGLNQLPDFISPFPAGFEYDMEQLKTISHRYIENTLLVHPREDYWLHGALQIYLLMEYVNTYYPKMKIIGNLSNWWIIRWAHAADLEFNDQYPILYLNMARNNIHQTLTTPKDSLLKFNRNIANNYYGGSGLQYLGDFIGKDTLNASIKQFYTENVLKPIKSNQFQTVLSENTTLPVNWFFEDYINSRSNIDFKITKVKKRGDILEVVVKNMKNTTLPISIYGKNKDTVLFKKWLPPIDSTATIMLPAEGVRKLVLNDEGIITEFNRRNNYKKVKGFLNRPVQFRLFQDVEDPDYNQLFFMPIVEYNLYDGISVGAKLYNKTVLPKGIYYKVEPQYALRSNTLIGSGSITYTQQLNQGNLYSMRYGIGGSYYSYDEDLFYKKFTPSMTFAFRNKDLRDNEKQFINLRSVNVFQDEDLTSTVQEPNYSVFNFQYVYSNPNLINYFRGVVDYQISQKFSKVSATFEYRKLFLNNRQLNVRMFAGTFIFNDTRENEDFFSFALDRPTDYLFDYNYYGRSEDSGLFSQQLIVAEGGFKSQLKPAFSNSWITTINASTNIWRWIYAYADAGLVNNSGGRGTQGVFDSGIRLSLVADYFELYFPLYSNLGWEPSLPDYDQKIRFIVTLSPKTLLSLFTRAWY